MFRRFPSALILLPLALCVGGCLDRSGPKPKDQKPTFPVSGVVEIDGKPTEGVQLFVYEAASAPADVMTPVSNISSVSGSVTEKDGKFAFSTYVPGDGLPAGSYVVSVYWNGGVMQPLDNLQDREPKLSPAATKLNRKYGVPSKSSFKFTVDKEPVDLKTLELSTK